MPRSVYVHEAHADLPGVAFGVMRTTIIAQARANRLEILEDADSRLTVETAHGLIGLRPGRDTETAGMVAARNELWLFVMKNAVLARMRQIMPDVAELMRWSGSSSEGTLPPNFQFVRVQSVVELGPAFLRVILEGEDLSQHGDQAIHFRLVQPPERTEARWPTLALNGSIDWPEGPGTPHKPVYTARSVDYTNNTLVTDIFVHEGGQTTLWAQQLLSGDRSRSVVGLLGPSGGGLFKAQKVLMATDETGFPAAARILENLPHGVTGELLLEAEFGDACNYPISAPAGIALRWLARARGERLADATLAAIQHHVGAKIWFAGERGHAQRVRDAAKSAGWDAADLRVSGFWRITDGRD